MTRSFLQTVLIVYQACDEKKENHQPEEIVLIDAQILRPENLRFLWRLAVKI